MGILCRKLYLRRYKHQDVVIRQKRVDFALVQSRCLVKQTIVDKNWGRAL